MKSIAALLTCHNRKDKTLNALKTLYSTYEKDFPTFTLDVYVTDDGSSDGTSEAIKKLFPKVHLLQGDGNLFWAEGMRHSWKEALKKDYDAYFLLNDDVELYPNIFDQIIFTHNHSLEKYGKAGIYIGATEDKYKNQLTYSGSIILNKFLYTQKRLPANGQVQKCDLANANIMVATRSVVNSIGILSEGYSHGMADYDYSLTASRKNIPVLVAPEYCGHCENDHKDTYDGFAEMSFVERKAYLYKPTGLAFDSYLKYMKKFFPFRYILVAFFGWLKLYFPRIYLNYFKNR
ncbi:glycosyltransferase family 2 protein [Maribacter algicola]|uniref:Glycosyltransferase family 2 protein n=1 Tax=Meishania litoralis TaxID=3434685 RepID=A0ACC7LNX3_9FLAO